MTEATGPLAGIKIIDMSAVVLGPFATLILADLGAEVIKVESGAGDVMRRAGPAPHPGMGPIYTTLNRNKKSVHIDAKTPEGKDALRALLKDADVFLHNVRLAGIERLGFAYDDVQKLNENIVYVHCAGYGQGGPYEAYPAYDDLIQVATGFADMVRIRDGGEPSYVPSLVADKTVGLYAAYATIAALFHRQRSGEGQFVQVPMFETFTFFHFIENLYGETWQPGDGHMAYTRSVNPNRKPYPTKDGYIGLVPYSDEQWEEFFKLGGRPEVFSDPRFSTYENRTSNITELYAIIEEVAAMRTTEDWLVLLREREIPAMGFKSNMDVLNDPHLTAVNFFEMLDHSVGSKYRTMKHPVHFSKTPANIRTEPPTLGEHTELVLSQLGLGTEMLD
ncbi:MAG: carnitine dehydratase [Ponticaulis sp.]|nr:carnitine dehydratase [Ponticaulis sp.]